jgi:HNH endonuclease
MHPWTPTEIQLLRQAYANTLTQTLAHTLQRTVKDVYAKASALGLRKSAEYMASDRSGRVQRGKQHPSMVASQFKPGMTPWNKGLHWDSGGRSHETRFKPGQLLGAAQHNYVPIGTLRIGSKSKLLERKVTDDPSLYPARRWVPVHRLVWEAAHGPLPAGHIAVFKPGQFTNVEGDITLDRLECITRAENMRRNSCHTRMPVEVARLMQLKGAITRQVNRINREHREQHPAQEATP